ncbi:MAG: S8 family serine peptidase, partial [Bdellovibrionaceae bacterium]|nr:S8 family serine peptidase [Pseudobdellovibrionaceae bacterium]
EGPGPLAAAALANGTASGRDGNGTVYVFAAGNGLDVLDNANADGFANSIHTIAVSAVNDFGFQSYYSEPGACILVAAPPIAVPRMPPSPPPI